MNDELIIGGITFNSRLLLGTGKFSSLTSMKKSIEEAEADIVTVALRRADIGHEGENILDFIPSHCHLMPNTSGARIAEEAVRIARISQELGCGNLIKIEVIQDQRYLLPNNEETIKATEILAKEGFVVFPYMKPDLMSTHRLVDAVVVNTAVASATNPEQMALAFKHSVIADRLAYLAGTGMSVLADMHRRHLRDF